MMSELQDYIEAGKVAREVAEKSKSLIKTGASLLETAETIEGWIKDRASIAFPVNISVNENASHYTPSFDEKTVFGERDVVNVDIGTQVNGFVGDIAYTIDLSKENGKLVDASEAALKDAISLVKAGRLTKDIGKAVEKTITGYGFKPIRNLSGHGLKAYEVHAEPSIPNVDVDYEEELEEGQIIAIEPFASTGDGMVREDRRTEIFSFDKEALTRNMDARNILAFIKKEYNTLPFAERWLAKNYSQFKLKIALKELLTRGALIQYPILRDRPGSLVSQAEVTLLVEKEGCKILS
jgi:methionyl aminopeptidase